MDIIILSFFSSFIACGDSCTNFVLHNSRPQVDIKRITPASLTCQN